MTEKHNSGNAPFVKSKRDRRGQHGSSVDFKSILQSLIVVGLTSLILMYATQKVVVQRIDNIDKSVDKLGQKIERISRDLYMPRGR
jgi:hypothetical protein